MHNPIYGLGGSSTALVTPFLDTRVDWTALSRLAERQIDRGTACLIVCGSTGEAASLILSEYARAVRTVAKASGRVPVIAGCTALATSAAIAMGIEAASAGADALLCAVPPYVKPTQEGIIAHVRAIAHATDLPHRALRCPVALGRGDRRRNRGAAARRRVDDRPERSTSPQICRAPRGCARAAATPSRSGAAMTRRHPPIGRWAALAASRSPPTWRRRCARCCIAHGTAAIWTSSPTVRDLLEPLHAVLFRESNPIPVKAALASLGLCSDEVRLPLTRATLATQERLLAVMPKIALAEEHAAQQPVLALAG